MIIVFEQNDEMKYITKQYSFQMISIRKLLFKLVLSMYKSSIKKAPVNLGTNFQTVYTLRRRYIPKTKINAVGLNQNNINITMVYKKK